MKESLTLVIDEMAQEHNIDVSEPTNFVDKLRVFVKQIAQSKPRCNPH